MAIYDCFPMFNELDLLEIRMEILNDVVDYFVIQEASTTFSGKVKPLYYKENEKRFEKFKHKIIHNVFMYDNPSWNHWDRDVIHKNEIGKALVNCKDDDIILISDLDEIPNFVDNPLQSFYKPDMLFHMMQNMYYYYINVLKENNWYGTKICSYSYFKNTCVDAIRNSKDKGIKISNGGWHFSFLGGSDAIIQKIQSWGHQEYNNDFIKNNVLENVKNNRDIFYRPDSVFNVVPVDQTYPKYIIDNISKFDNFIRK